MALSFMAMSPLSVVGGADRSSEFLARKQSAGLSGDADERRGDESDLPQRYLAKNRCRAETRVTVENVIAHAVSIAPCGHANAWPALTAALSRA
jgi:hypothetical protein